MYVWMLATNHQGVETLQCGRNGSLSLMEIPWLWVTSSFMGSSVLCPVASEELTAQSSVFHVELISL